MSTACIGFTLTFPTHLSSHNQTTQYSLCSKKLPTIPASSLWTMLDKSNSNVATNPQRIACLCQYNGAAFCGWERKPTARTVQSVLEHAILQLCGKSVLTSGASKTDAGTHALGQVFHFDPPRTFSHGRAWMKALNKRLPSDLLISASAQVPISFHARKRASWRRYRYTILTTNHNSVFLSPFVWHYYQKPLDVARMNIAAQTLRCEHPKNFSAFRKARSPAAHTDIAIHNISVRRAACSPNLVQVEVCASWFVYGMMRLLTGALIEVGSGTKSVEEFYNIFTSGERRRITFSAPANGLCLLEIGYPSQEYPFITSGTQACRESSMAQGLALFETV